MGLRPTNSGVKRSSPSESASAVVCRAVTSSTRTRWPGRASLPTRADATSPPVATVADARLFVDRASERGAAGAGADSGQPGGQPLAADRAYDRLARLHAAGGTGTIVGGDPRSCGEALGARRERGPQDQL